MKIIKVSTELEMSVHEFPEGTMREQNKALYDLIGNGCDIVEHVMPKRLYTELKMPSTPVKEPGKCVSMLIDEEGRLKPNKANLIGSYLYEFDKHGCPIVGNILFIGEKMGDDGVEFCGISEENFSLLETELKNMITAIKATVKEMVTLTARAVRGGKATSFGHMCHSCFAKWLTSHNIPVPDLENKKEIEDGKEKL